MRRFQGVHSVSRISQAILFDGITAELAGELFVVMFQRDALLKCR